jgi:hypothetical protein
MLVKKASLNLGGVITCPIQPIKDRKLVLFMMSYISGQSTKTLRSSNAQALTVPICTGEVEFYRHICKTLTQR